MFGKRLSCSTICHSKCDFLLYKLIDLVVKVAESMFPEAFVLNLRDLVADLSHDLLMPFVGLGEVVTLKSKERATFFGLLFFPSLLGL